ncbi:MAG: LysE family transporter [Spirochaetales bacterium]|nr:LysE family transporter [Spirochaetales bacterium]
MMSALLRGLLTGFALQLAIGPVFFYIANAAIRSGLVVSIAGTFGVVLVDYLYIGLAISGIGTVLEKPAPRKFLAVFGPLVLCGFGIMMIRAGAGSMTGSPDPVATVNSAFICFRNTVLLTVSSPLTILFWMGLFSTRAFELKLSRSGLILFGAGAGLSTLIFLSAASLLFSVAGSMLPDIAGPVMNILVGAVLIGYAAVRFRAAFRT